MRNGSRGNTLSGLKLMRNGESLNALHTNTNMAVSAPRRILVMCFAAYPKTSDDPLSIKLLMTHRWKSGFHPFDFSTYFGMGFDSDLAESTVCGQAIATLIMYLMSFFKLHGRYLHGQNGGESHSQSVIAKHHQNVHGLFEQNITVPSPQWCSHNSPRCAPQWISGALASCA